VAVQHHTPRAAAPATPSTAAPLPPTAPDAAGAGDPTAAAVDPAIAGLQADGYATIRDIFLRPGVVSRWPLYVRQAKQVIRTANESFDERRHGFNGIVDALRFAQREGLFRLDRDRQGVIRIYPGALLAEPGSDATAEDGQPAQADAEPVLAEMFEGGTTARGADGDDLHEPGDVNGNRAYPGEEPRASRPGRRGRGGRGRGRGPDDRQAVEETPVEHAPVEHAPVQDGQLFPDASSPVVEPERAAAGEREVQPDETPAVAAPRKRAAAKKAAAPRKKAPAAAKKTARKTSR
jgi:hypothetical protein